MHETFRLLVSMILTEYKFGQRNLNQTINDIEDLVEGGIPERYLAWWEQESQM